MIENRGVTSGFGFEGGESLTRVPLGALIRKRYFKWLKNISGSSSTCWALFARFDTSPLELSAFFFGSTSNIPHVGIRLGYTCNS